VRTALKSLVAAFALAVLVPAQAALEITITEGVVGARPIAVVPFAWEGEGSAPVDLAAIVDNNLARSGEFSPVERDDMVARPGVGDDINYSNWRTIDTDHVVVGEVTPQAEDVRVRFRLLDVLEGEQVVGYSFNAGENALRRVAHEISDIVFEEITGNRGAFGTRIAYVAVNDAGEEREYSVQIADYDGQNGRNILTSDDPIMSPAWSPDGERLAYVSCENDRRPAVFVHDIAAGERERVSARTGINSAPAWSPDGRKLAITLSHEGSPSIYVMNLDSGDVRRVTSSRAIDTSPSWTPDGNALLFTSDRAGGPQIYRIAADGSGQAKRLTFDGNYNTAPDVAPDGDRFAFIHRTRDGHDRVAVQEMDDGAMRVLTDSRQDDSVSFAPNGRMLLYATRHNGRDVLGAVSTDGRAQVRLEQTSGNVREPTWGPFRD